MKSPKITIIIPVYNSEDYLDECLLSIKNQTLDDFEVICINDGSTDSSEQILAKYESLIPHFKVIKQKNQGVAAARNTGLTHAQGDYIWFIDADDWINIDSIRLLVPFLNQHSPDILGFMSDKFNTITKKVMPDPVRDLSLIPEDFVERLCTPMEANDFIFKLPIEVWNKVFKRAFLKDQNIKFNPQFWGIEDGLFSTECIIKCSNLMYIKHRLYSYRTANSSSLAHAIAKPDHKKCDISILYAEACEDLIRENEKFNINYDSLRIRNIDRILNIYNNSGFRVRKTMFPLFKSYLKKHEASFSFLQYKPNLENEIRSFNTCTFLSHYFGSFIYKKRITENNSIIIYLFTVRFFTTQNRRTFIKIKLIYSIWKKEIHLTEGQEPSHIKYYLFGIPALTVNKVDPNNLKSYENTTVE